MLFHTCAYISCEIAMVEQYNMQMMQYNELLYRAESQRRMSCSQIRPFLPTPNCSRCTWPCRYHSILVKCHIQQGPPTMTWQMVSKQSLEGNFSQATAERNPQQTSTSKPFKCFTWWRGWAKCHSLKKRKTTTGHFWGCVSFSVHFKGWQNKAFMVQIICLTSSNIRGLGVGAANKNSTSQGKSSPQGKRKGALPL